MYYVERFTNIREDLDVYLIVLLSAILFVSVIDWFFGWINAKFNGNVTFISSIALYGIIKKMMYFIVLIFFGVMSLIIVPSEISIPAITTLYVGYILSECNSILSHLNVTNDGKKGEVLMDFMKRIVGGKK